MSEFTDARSRPGQRLNTGTDDMELFITGFSGLVITAWEESNDYESLTWTRNISQGKADTFPIIGRKRDATEHEPGERILGGRVEHNEIEISLDPIVVDSVFIAEWDELLLHYSIQGPYAQQLGESLSTTYDRRVAIMHILASRVTERPYTGGPLPNGYFDANVATDPAKMEEAAFAAVEWIKRFDVGGGPLSYRLGWGQYLALSKYTQIDTVDTSGSGNRSTGKVGLIAGLQPYPTNHIPRSNITTGRAKYQGDFTGVVGHISNRMAVGTLARRGLRVTVTDQEDRLGKLIIASKLNGHGILRPECSFEVATSDITGVRGTNHPDKLVNA